MHSEPTAYDITNNMIRQTGIAVRNGDFDAFMRYFTVPFILETYSGKQFIPTRLALEKHFRAVCEFRRQNAIVDSVRENIMAEFHDRETIRLCHVSHLLLGCGTVFDRYPTHSVIRRIDGKWLTQYCQYGVDDKDAFVRALAMYAKTPQQGCGV